MAFYKSMCAKEKAIKLNLSMPSDQQVESLSILSFPFVLAELSQIDYYTLENCLEIIGCQLASIASSKVTELLEGKAFL